MLLAASCGVCATPVPPAMAVCPRCGSRLEATVGAPERGDLPTLLLGGQRAGVGVRVVAAVLDVFFVVAVTALFVLGFAYGTHVPSPAVTWLGVGLLLVCGASLWVVQSLTGRTLGKLILGLRTVDLFTGLPLGFRRELLERWTGSVALDVRAGRDPTLTVTGVVLEPIATVAATGYGLPRASGPVPAPTPVPAPPPAPVFAPPSNPLALRTPASPPMPVLPPVSAPPWVSAPPPVSAPPWVSAPPPIPVPLPVPGLPRPAASPVSAPLRPAAPAPAPPAQSVVIAFDDGQRLEVSGTVLVGRNPAPGPDDEVDALIPLNDLSRSISKTHACLRWDGRVLWVSDRASTNGTAVVDASGTRQISPQVEEPAFPGGRVNLGDRFFTIESIPPESLEGQR